MSSLVSVDQVSPARLRKFFAPTYVALVGATDKSRWSTSTFGNLKNFDGPVYLINPRGMVGGELYLNELESLDDALKRRASPV